MVSPKGNMQETNLDRHAIFDSETQCKARTMYEYTRNVAAFNMLYTFKVRANQYGRVYTFDDGSRFTVFGKKRSDWYGACAWANVDKTAGARRIR